jgi:alpha-acetolactate decarboxylase
VRIADVSIAPHTFGVGALSHLRGEITVLDDIAWIARPSDDGTISVSHYPVHSTPDSAALLVVAHVESWRELTVPTTFRGASSTLT